MFKNMKIGWRMGWSFSLVIVLMIALIVVSSNEIKVTHEKLERIVKVNIVRIQLANTMMNDTREVSISLRTILLKKDSAKIPDLRNKIAEIRKEYDASFKKLQELPSKDPKNLFDLISKVKVAQDVSRQLNNRVLDLALAGKPDDALDLMTKDADPAMRQWIKNIDDLITYSEERNTARYDESVQAQAVAHTTMFILGAAVIVLSVLVVILLTLSITRPLSAGVQAADRIASGDLTVDLSTVDQRGDESGVLMQSLSKMVDNLREQTRGILDGVNVLASSSSEISATVSQVTSTAQESSAAVLETTTTMEEVKQTVNATSQKAREMADKAQQGLQVAQEGRQASEKLAAGMQRIREQMTVIADTIMKLSEQGQAIGEIIATVEDVADQSNLLAVNAAVEAARAGEHGKGFAVVAQEIKGLAEQSKQATRQVRSILGDIQKATGTAVMATEQGSKVVDTGVNEATGASESIQALSRHVAESVQSAGQIAAANKEQITAINQVASAMENIKEATHQNAASMKQLEAAVQSLKDMGQNLSRSVARYKV